MKVQDINQKQKKQNPLTIDQPIDQQKTEDRYIAITSYAPDKPERLVAAYDLDGKACKLDDPDYPYIYFPILNPYFYNCTTCVKSCHVTMDTIVECQTNTLIKSCTKSWYLRFSMTSYPSASANLDLSTWFCVYPSNQIFERACFPTQALDLIGQASSFSSAIDLNRLTAWVYDLATAKYIILVSFCIAFVLGMIYMIILRFLEGLSVWISILLYFVALAVLSTYTWNQHLYYQTKSDQNTHLVEFSY